MAIYCISYDLMLPISPDVYTRISEHLKTYEHSKVLESFWLIETDKTPEAISNDLQTLLDRNDEAFIIRVSKEFAQIGYRDTLWLIDPGRSW